MTNPNQLSLTATSRWAAPVCDRHGVAPTGTRQGSGLPIGSTVLGSTQMVSGVSYGSQTALLLPAPLAPHAARFAVKDVEGRVPPRGRPV